MKNILVAMPYSQNLAQEMLLGLYSCFNGIEDHIFKVKFHPATSSAKVKMIVPKWPAHFQETQKSIRELLGEMDLVIYAASTVGLEALIHGTPVVRFYSEYRLDDDPLDIFDEKLVSNCSGHDLREVVTSILEKTVVTSNQRPEMNDALKQFFSPVDEQKWLKIAKSQSLKGATNGKA